MDALRRWTKLLATTVEECMKDNTPMLAAGLSFYTLLSMAPALWLAVAAAGAIIGRESARLKVMNWTNETAGYQAAEYMSMLADQVEKSSPLATVVGIVSMFFGATMVFGALHDSLNRIWNVPAAAGWSIKGIVKGYLTKRLLAFGVVLFVGALILLSLFAEAALNATVNFIPEYLPVPAFLLWSANFLISIVTMMLLFGGIYRFLHNAYIAWWDVFVGASLTAILFAIGKFLIGFYLGRAGLTSAFGAAGSLVVLLLWVYYSAQIFFFGAEFTEVYARGRNVSFQPRPIRSQ